MVDNKKITELSERINERKWVICLQLDVGYFFKQFFNIFHIAGFIKKINTK